MVAFSHRLFGVCMQNFRLRLLSWSPVSTNPAIDWLREKGVEVVITRTTVNTTEDELIELLQDYDAVIPGTEPFTRRVIESLPRLRTIARSGVGFNSIDLEAAQERGVVVSITPGANKHAVADHAFGLIIMLAHQIPANQQMVANQRWQRVPGRDVHNKTLGIIGVGNIGKQVAVRSSGFGMTLLGYDIAPDEEFGLSEFLFYVSLEHLLKHSDFITLHVPYYNLTHHMIGARELAMLKPDAYLINTARGGLIDEAALYQALVDQKLAGAALDVMENEPDFSNPLLTLDNVIWTPHVAGITFESRNACVAGACHNVWNALTGEGPIVSQVHPGDVG